MYKTQMHSLHKPLKEQTYFKETLPEPEESQSEQQDSVAFSNDDNEDNYLSENEADES